MNETAYENEIFSGLMEDFIRSYGTELLRQNRQLAANGGAVNALSYVRCRERIRREFAALHRRSLVKGLRISGAAACAVLALSAGVLMLVPSLHDAVFGRSEIVVNVTVPKQNDTVPAFRRNMPMIPDPEETEAGSFFYPIVSREYSPEDEYYIDIDAYHEEQRRAFEEERRRNQSSFGILDPFAPTETPKPTPTAPQTQPELNIPPDTRRGNTRN